MPKKNITPPHGRGKLQHWLPGESGNPKGAERKYVSKLTDFGYNLSEINQTIQNLLAMKADEIGNVESNENATVLEKIIARSLTQSVETGGIKPIEKLLNRAFGKPVETVQTNNNTNQTLTINAENSIDAAKEYQDLMK